MNAEHKAQGSRLFHLTRRESWARERDPAGRYAPPSLGSEGFVHLSFPEQLEDTLAAHFNPRDALWLLELAPARVAPLLRLERSRGGALFPHLFRALEEDDVLRWWPLDGRAAPRLGARESEDRPPGRPGVPS